MYYSCGFCEFAYLMLRVRELRLYLSDGVIADRGYDMKATRAGLLESCIAGRKAGPINLYKPRHKGFLLFLDQVPEIYMQRNDFYPS